MEQSVDLRIAELEADLNNFDSAIRAEALTELATLAERGAIPLAPESELVNLHCHTFFSFNAYGYSPNAVAWLAKRRGFKLVGMVDFDVLDGVDEFLNACRLLGMRGSAAIETRIYIPEFEAYEINSPGEPGVCYHMGIGFTSSSVPPAAQGTLADLRQRSAQRNRGMIARVNSYLDPVTIDYERDLLPLTPGANPTERHMVVAYLDAARHAGRNSAEFWAEKLVLPREQVAAAMADAPQFQSLIRARLMKQGGVGYVQPGPETFPTLDTFCEMVTACGALPCAAWSDGTSSGERNIGALLELLISKGAAALNLIPDRNWNIADPEMRRVKVQNLYGIVRLANELALPINIGTEMNSFGQKLADDLSVPELAPVRQAFLDGSYFVYGHTALQRGFRLGYQSAWAQAYLPDRRERNAFYSGAGRLLRSGSASIAFDDSMTPAEILARCRIDLTPRPPLR